MVEATEATAAPERIGVGMVPAPATRQDGTADVQGSRGETTELRPRMARVELRPAMVFTCDACGRDNFMNLTLHQTGDGDFEALMPRFVTCGACAAEFPTILPGDDDEETDSEAA